MLLLDANIFLRFFVGDDKNQQFEVVKLFEEAKKGRVLLKVPQMVIFEINYGLKKYYGYSRSKISAALGSIILGNIFEVESKEIFSDALRIYASQNLDLADCFLISKSIKENLEIFSFDKKLQKYAKER